MAGEVSRIIASSPMVVRPLDSAGASVDQKVAFIRYSQADNGYSRSFHRSRLDRRQHERHAGHLLITRLPSSEAPVDAETARRVAALSHAVADLADVSPEIRRA